jgi:hypothetical protein
MKTIILTLLMLLSIRSFAQNEYNNCYFGETVGLNFNSNPPTVLFNSALLSESQYATFSDNSGNLLFYTNGNIVWNKQHQIMENGNINIGFYASNIIIIPFTNDNQKYYIVNIADNGGLYSLKYSVVDLSFNSGLGKITIKDILIKNDVSPMTACIKNTNNNDYWLITKEGWNENLPTNLYVFSITNAGISSTFISTITTSISIGMSIMPSIDGSKIVLYSVISGSIGQHQISIWNFNRSTGSLANSLTFDLTFENLTNAVLSPDNTKLYVPPYQFNLQAGSIANILNSKIKVFPQIPEQSGLQIMPDGKIYIFNYDLTYLDVINEPNNLGTLCNYTENAVSLSTYHCFGDFPRIITPFVINQIKILVNNNCIEETTLFQINNTTNIQSVLWNFGDSQTSTEINPSHAYASAGTYTVTLEVTFIDNSTQTITKTIEIFNKLSIMTIEHE